VKKFRVPIESLYLGLYDGPHATPKPSADGPVFLGIGNLTEDGKLDLTDIRHIAEDDFGDWTKRVVPQAGDIVFTYEATLNRYAIIPEGFRGCLGRRLALIRPSTCKVNPRFLFFYFFGEEWRQIINKNTLSGATVDRIPLTEFPTFEVNLPSRPEQDRIVEILSAYDDLIENNTRRIKTLEEMAQMIFREWFVNFCFPGHEKEKMVESELGPIPERFSIGLLGELAELKSGFAFKSSSFSAHGSYGIVTIRNVHDGLFSPDCQSKITELPNNLPSFCVLNSCDVLMSLTGNIGRACLVYGKNLLLNQRVAKVIAKRANDLWFVYFFLRMPETRKRLVQISTGVAQQNLSPVQAMDESVVMPSSSQRDHFHEIVDPIVMEIVNLFAKNSALRKTRDLLLPKLISGEVSVEHLEAEAASQIA